MRKCKKTKHTRRRGERRREVSRRLERASDKNGKRMQKRERRVAGGKGFRFAFDIASLVAAMPLAASFDSTGTQVAAMPLATLSVSE